MIPLIVIVGPTASGKSAIAEQLADKFCGVIVNSDARQIYRGIDIVSAAPRGAARKNTRLYGIKAVDEPFSFAEFVARADFEIANIYAQGKIPIVVGGTGLYVDALINRFVPPPTVLPEIRAKVQALSLEGALSQLKKLDPLVLNTIDVQNPRRVQRALEVVLQTGQSIRTFGSDVGASPYRPLIIGWNLDRADLHKNIYDRVNAMWASGAVDEVRILLGEGHKLDEPGMLAIGISEIADYIHGKVSEEDAKKKMVERTRQYARRQITWFKKDQRISWYTSFDDICHSVHDFLQTNYKQF